MDILSGFIGTILLILKLISRAPKDVRVDGKNGPRASWYILWLSKADHINIKTMQTVCSKIKFSKKMSISPSLLGLKESCSLPSKSYEEVMFIPLNNLNNCKSFISTLL